MQRTISSKQTLLVKFVTPVFIAFYVLILARGAFLSVFVFSLQNVIFPLLLLGISAYVIWYNLRLKKVTILSKSLLISNHIKEIKVPFSEINLVTESFWNNIHPVTIHLKTPTEFGSKIVFMPTYRFFGFWTSHPIVRELNGLARKQKYNSSLDAWY